MGEGWPRGRVLERMMWNDGGELRDERGGDGVMRQREGGEEEDRGSWEWGYNSSRVVSQSPTRCHGNIP